MAMACFKIVSVVTILSVLFWGSSVTAISTEEVDGMLMVLRAEGHMLLANAISTSDMLFDILSLPSLTLLAPRDPTLFALDMTNTPPFYISTLRLHALPLRLSWSQFRLLPNGSLLPTLLPSRQLHVLRRRQVNTLVVDGGSSAAVEVVMPGLYYGRDVAVHALSGILTFRSSKIPTDDNNNNNNLLFPRNNNTNHTFFFPPLPRIPIINHTNTTTHFFPTTNNNNNASSPFSIPPLPRIPIVNHTIPIPIHIHPTNLPHSSPLNRTVLAPSPAPDPHRKKSLQVETPALVGED